MTERDWEASLRLHSVVELECAGHTSDIAWPKSVAGASGARGLAAVYVTLPSFSMCWEKSCNRATLDTSLFFQVMALLRDTVGKESIDRALETRQTRANEWACTSLNKSTLSRHRHFSQDPRRRLRRHLTHAMTEGGHFGLSQGADSTTITIAVAVCGWLGMQENPKSKSGFPRWGTPSTQSHANNPIHVNGYMRAQASQPASRSLNQSGKCDRLGPPESRHIF